ncbi:hypothetical protein GQ607_010980 [Colletotrichum asianum]|uniref:Secreted protein n=1 Tax=Colletotrichum asianum TaxID=702518 RepID=A0A8H3W9W7_9PEZI|nr:hypothetical protein GQ607_010980 [Colletotrichum asianum]
MWSRVLIFVRMTAIAANATTCVSCGSPALIPSASRKLPRSRRTLPRPPTGRTPHKRLRSTSPSPAVIIPVSTKKSADADLNYAARDFPTRVIRQSERCAHRR